jgi:plastocyanin
MRTFIRTFVTASLFALGLVACGGGETPATDAATPRDSAATPDTGAGDGGGLDSGGTADTGSADSGSADVGPIDGSVEGCAVTYSGCTTLEDHTGEDMVTVTVVADPTTLFAYSPHCIRVSAGTTVSIPGSAIHPLTSAPCSPSDTPLPPDPTTTDGDYTFTGTGSYGFYCAVHGAPSGAGMAGVIVVE